MKKVIVVLLLGLVFQTSYSQHTKYASEDKKALKFYKEATTFLRRAQFDEAVEPLRKALKRDPNFIEVYLAYGSLYYRTGNDSLTHHYFNQAIMIDPDYHKSKYAYYVIGELSFKYAAYDQAKEYLMHYLRTSPSDVKKVAKARKLLKNVEYAMEAVKSPFEYNIKELSGHANYFPLAYFPTLSVDQKTLYFTKRDGLRVDDDEDIFYSTIDSVGEWSMPLSISDNINTIYNEGAASVSGDGRSLVFTSCDKGGSGYGSCDIFIAEKQGDEWSKPKNIGSAINSNSWEAQASLSADGRTIYFVSNRRGGRGGKDIWLSTKDENDRWSPAENLGIHVNSEADEIYPFIHANGQTLFFASKGYEGLGGYDIYKSEINEEGEWSDPVNLGYPFNDSNDQVSIFVGADSKSGVFTIEKNTKMAYDSRLYSFTLPDTFQVTNKSAYVKGMVKDAITSEALEANLEIYNLGGASYYSKLKSDKINGDYTIVLTEGTKYAMYVSKTDYIFQDFSFHCEDLSTFDLEVLDIELQPLTVGLTIVLQNVFFDPNDYKLKRESVSELQIIDLFLENHPKVKVEISGHTDNVGSVNYNLELSTKRAKNVFDYLVYKGANEKQLSYKGYGSSAARHSNDNEEGRSKNRRIEFKVVSVGEEK